MIFVFSLIISCFLTIVIVKTIDQKTNFKQLSNKQKTKLQEISDSIKNQIVAINQLQKQQEEDQKKYLDLIEENKKEKIEQAKKEIDDWIISSQQAANEYSKIAIEKVNEEIFSENLKLSNIKEEIKEFSEKRAALNEALRIERKLDDELNAHKIQLSNNDKQDIQFLTDLSYKINNKEILNKLIWTSYLQQPFNQMINRIFGSNVPKNVIYCIENTETKQKYIGKTIGSVKDRWTQHIKSSLNIGQISHQLIHDALKGNWDKFSFSVIEEVKNANISEREHFYINTFESDKYGYNIKG